VTIDDLISRLARYPGNVEVRVLVLTRDGMFNDAVTANTDHVLLVEDATGGAVWITGSETDDPTAPRWVTTECHCGIEHDVDTTGAICELPARRER